MESPALEKLESVYTAYRESGGSVVSLLQDIQTEFGYIPQDAVHWMSGRTGIPASRFYGVATFYAQFYLEPRGKNIVTACCGTACHVKGAERVLTRLREELALEPGQETTRDGQFTLEKVACVGACSIAPVVIVNHKVFGKMGPDKVPKILGEYGEQPDE
ncbi:MAG: NADH-quinone oxidoreductase subunit NuoE [Thermodesulfobacteriota bacterium]